MSKENYFKKKAEELFEELRLFSPSGKLVYYQRIQQAIQEAYEAGVRDSAETYEDNAGLHSSQCFVCQECKKTILVLLSKPEEK